MLCINGINIALDRRESGSDVDFVSHAHSDHTAAAKRSQHMLASRETAMLMGSAAYSESMRDSRVSIELLDSGHMLGAKQLLAESKDSGERVVYTGDFKMQESRTARRIQVKEADTAIVDATYPEPGIRFDDRQEVESALQKWAVDSLRSGIVLFSAYAKGKSQEIISLLNEVGITPIVSKKVSAACKVYGECGVRLDYASAYDEGSDYESLMRGGFVGVTDSRRVDKLGSALGSVHGKRVFTAVATGFAKKFRFGTDAQFALSDHADFAQSREYIDMTGARQVFTYGHSADAFADSLRRAGYDANTLSAERKELARPIVAVSKRS